jgi:hypothetical protein
MSYCNNKNVFIVVRVIKIIYIYCSYSSSFYVAALWQKSREKFANTKFSVPNSSFFPDITEFKKAGPS